MKRIYGLVFILICTGIVFADAPWSPNVLACRVGGDTLNEGESCLAVDGNYMYCICNVNERNRVAVLPYGRSENGGQTWNSIWWMDPTPGIPWHSDPIILTDDSGYVHLFCQFSSTLIYHYLSTDHGLTWCDTSDVSGIGAGQVDKPWAVIYGNNIYVTYQQLSGTTGIRFIRSTDRGRTWTRQTIDNGFGLTALCVSPSGIIYCACRQLSGRRLSFSQSIDSGNTWVPFVTLDTACSYTTGYGDRAPLLSIAAPTDSNIILVLCDQRYGNWDVLYKYSTDRGTSWSVFTQLSDLVAGGQCKGWVTADPYGGLHFIWYHTPSWPTSVSSRWSVRYTYSNDYGVTVRPSIRLTDTTFLSPVTFMGEYHTIVCDSQNAYCVWTDGRDGDLDLWFSKAALSQIGIEENGLITLRKSQVELKIPAVVRNSLPLEIKLVHNSNVNIGIYDVNGRRIFFKNLGYQRAGNYQEVIGGLPKQQILFVRVTAGDVVTHKAVIYP